MSDTEILILKVIINDSIAVDEVLHFDTATTEEAKVQLKMCAGRVANGEKATLTLEGTNGKVLSLVNVTGLVYSWQAQPDRSARRGLPPVDPTAPNPAENVGLGLHQNNS